MTTKAFKITDLFMPPTLEKLKGHIALGLCLCPSFHASVQNLLRYSFEIS